jgi:hypothetical protein
MVAVALAEILEEPIPVRDGDSPADLIVELGAGPAGAPPPAYDSTQMATELAELQAHDRAATLNRVGVFWVHDPAGRRPPRYPRPRRPFSGRR